MSETPEETTGEQADRQLAPGDFATDREGDATLVVLAETDVPADQHRVAATGETVAESNPDYPADSEVVFCVYRNQLDSTFGETWRNRSTEYLAFTVGDHGVPVYSFPRARLDRETPDMAGLDGTPHAETDGDADGETDGDADAEEQDSGATTTE
jgi:hypothetical protein